MNVEECIAAGVCILCEGKDPGCDHCVITQEELKALDNTTPPLIVCGACSRGDHENCSGWCLHCSCPYSGNGGA